VFDVLTVAAVADELAATVLDGRIQKIGLVDRRTLAAEIYAGGHRHALIASADDRAPRLHLASAMPSLDAELVTPFGLLLRKYLRGGLLIGIEQPPLERLVRLSIAKHLPTDHERRERRRAGRLGLAPEFEPEPEPEPTTGEEDEEGEGDATFVHLAIEVMGRHSNLILIDDDGAIMEAAKRVTPAMSRVRPIAPRLPYLPPPPIARPDPRRLTASSAIDLLAALPLHSGLARGLVSALRGVSPQMAREVAFRVTGSADARVEDVPPGGDGAAALARETRALLEPLLTSAWSPRLYRAAPEPSAAAEAETGDPIDPAAGDLAAGDSIAYAPVPMAHLAATLVEEPVPSISTAIALIDGRDGATATPVRHAQRRERLLGLVRAARAKEDRRLAAVREQGAKAAEADRLRRWGELIYANLWLLNPGQASFEADGERVDLLPGLDAKETAQEYFEQYRKAQSAGVHQGELETEIAAEVAYLDQIATLAAQAAGFAELEALAAEWEIHAGPQPGATRRPKPAPMKRPRPLLDDDGNAVFVGRTAAQNEIVTFDLVGPDDTWLHARGAAGSHVVVRWRVPRGDERPETIEAAARLAAWYSAGREGARVEVDVTRRRHVRKIKGVRPGLVTYRNERTIAVRPGNERAVAEVLRLPEER